MQFTAENMLKYLAYFSAHIFNLLTEHHSFWRFDASVELVILASEVLARIEHIVGQFESKVQNWYAEICISLIE